MSIGTKLTNQDGQKYKWTLTERLFGHRPTKRSLNVDFDVHPAPDDLAAAHYLMMHAVPMT